MSRWFKATVITLIVARPQETRIPSILKTRRFPNKTSPSVSSCFSKLARLFISYPIIIIFRSGNFQRTSSWIWDLIQGTWCRYTFRYVSDNGAWYWIIDTNGLGEQNKLSNLPSGSCAARSAAVPMGCTVGKSEHPRHKLNLIFLPNYR